MFKARTARRSQLHSGRSRVIATVHYIVIYFDTLSYDTSVTTV